MTTLSDIDAALRVDAEARDLLRERVQAMKDGLADLHRMHLPGIRRALNRVAELDARAKALVANAPECFVKPRTVVMHGLRAGYKKQPGRTTFDKPASVVARIDKAYPKEQAELLVHTERKPNKEALSKLSAADLRKLGVTIEAAGDVVVVEPVDSALDKMLAALLKAATDDATDPADATADTAAGAAA